MKRLVEPSAERIATRLDAVRARIAAAAVAAGRDPDEIALLAVTKRVSPAAIRAAHAAGQRLFGESYVQEALPKLEALADLDGMQWHFIGRIQTNKTRLIAERFAWAHGLCEAGHARRLSQQRPPGQAPLQVCIQVRSSDEASKSGLPPAVIGELLALCTTLPGLEVRGLMTLPAPVEDPDAQREPFRRLREWRDRLASARQPLDTLSMGMSDDLEAAILEGATCVRIGSAIFGPRDP